MQEGKTVRAKPLHEQERVRLDASTKSLSLGFAPRTLAEARRELT